MTPRETYLATLVQYYDEEIEGEAFFATAAALCPDPTQREAATLLAQVESHAAKAVAPLLTKYDLTPSNPDALTRAGVADASESWAGWEAMIANMKETYPGYLADFQALEAMAPPEDRAILAFLTDHEVAAIAFLDKVGTDLAEAMKPLRRYLASIPGPA